MPSIFAPVLPIVLLFASNIFMMFAWYGHLKYPNAALWVVILIAWGFAFVEYCFAVPANRIGYRIYSAAELKTIQEIITLIIFAGFSILYLGEKFTLHHGIGFTLIAAGAAFVFFAPKGA